MRISLVFRLGRGSKRARPLLLQLAGHTHKNLIAESLYKLKHADSKFKKVIILHHVTKLERQECKRLVYEAKLRTEEEPSGEFHLNGRGMPGYMRIIKLIVKN